MHEDHLYEFAVLRYSPRVEREEFLNLGLVMMCKRQRWMRVEWKLDADRLRVLRDCAPTEEIERQLQTFSNVACGRVPEMADWPVEDRFRWLTAEKSACLSTSRPHPGITDDLNSTFTRLFAEYVL